MKAEEIKRLIEALKKDLAKADEMWNAGKPHASIVGWLEGGMKSAIVELEVALEYINNNK